MLRHSLKERDGTTDIDAVVLDGDFTGFTDSLLFGQMSDAFPKHIARVRVSSTNLQCSKVDDIVNVWVLDKDLVQGHVVRDVGLVQLRSLSADELYSVDCLL